MTGLSRAPRASISAEERGLIPPYPVIACVVVFFWSISVRALIYTLMPTVAAELQFTSSTAGAVIAVLMLGYCAGNWSSGWLPGSRKRRILGGVLLSLGATELVSAASSLWLLLVAAPLLGFGIGVYLPLGLGIVVEAAEKGRKGFYMALHEVSASLGNFGGAAYVALVIAWIDWHTSILLWSVVGVLGLLVFTRMPDGGGREVRQRRRGSLSCGRNLLYSSFVYAAAMVPLAGLIALMPLILVRAWGLDQATAAAITGNARLVSVLGVVMAGVLADRWGHIRTTMALQALTLVGALAMSLEGYGPLFLASLMVMSVGASGGITLVPLVIAEAHPAAQRDQAMSIASGVGGGASMVLIPPLLGALLDAGLPTAPMLLASAITAAAIMVTRRLGRSAAADLPSLH